MRKLLLSPFYRLGKLRHRESKDLPGQGSQAPQPTVLSSSPGCPCELEFVTWKSEADSTEVTCKGTVHAKAQRLG